MQAQNNFYQQPPIVCDTGTGYIKIGYSTDNFPRYTIPGIVGRPMLRYDQKIDNVELKSIMIGDEAAPYRVMLELNQPMEQGIVQDWDDMYLLWEYCFNKIKAVTKGQTILLTEAIMNPYKNRVKTAEVMFEKFNFGSLQIQIQALLALYAEGLMTSLLLDSGDGVTHCIPVIEGTILSDQVMRMGIAGRHITNYLIKLLFMRGYAFNSTADFELVREIKEKYCFVCGDLAVERKLAQETTIHEREVRLPDNTCIKIGRERFEACELLFTPYYGGYESPGVAEIVFQSIMKCPMDVRRLLYESCMISGGSTMFPGFPTRLQNELKAQFQDQILNQKKNLESETRFKFNIIDPPRRKFNVFIGAAFVAEAMSKLPQFWITKQQYEEMGEKCIPQQSNSMNSLQK